MMQTSVPLPEPVFPPSGFHGFKKRFVQGWNERLLAELDHRENGTAVVYKNPFGPPHLANSYKAGWSAVGQIDIDAMMVMNGRASGDSNAGRRLYEETRQRLFGKRSGARHVG